MSGGGFLSGLVALLSSLSCAAAAPFETSIRLERGDPNQVVLRWESTPGSSYNVLSTDQIDSPSWSSLNSQPLVSEGGQMDFRVAVTEQSQYYQVVELGAVRVALVGISEQMWETSDEWVPANQLRTVSGSKTLITLGCWWDSYHGSFGNSTPLPIDTNGLFTAAVNPATFGSEDPVRVQVCYQSSAASGSHSVTPPILGVSGDGFFLLVEAEGLASNSVVRDSGHARNWHPYNGGAPDPNSIEAITVSTDGSEAQIGDLAVAIFVMDPHRNPDINISLPAGWTSLGFNDFVVDNVGYRACYKVITTAGKQTVTCTWTDNTTFAAEAAIVVFKSDEQQLPSLGSE